MSIQSAFDFLSDAGVEVDYDGFNGDEPVSVEETLKTNWSIT